MTRDVNLNEPETGTPADDAWAALARERDDLQDRLLRSAAEFDNYRKRTDRERRELTEAASIDLIRDLLPVLDDLSRAIDAAAQQASGDPTAQNLVRGVDLIQREVFEVLRKRGVERLDVVGRDFDPRWHEAVANDPLDGRRPGEVTAEVRRGYRIGDRLLRPAMVKVASE
jgi:molecular chaperone GrpE